MARSQLSAFVRYCETVTGRSYGDYSGFEQFSCNEFRTFWRLFLRWCKLDVEGETEPVCAGDSCESASFFSRLRLNFVENLLRQEHASDGLPAVTACRADRPPDAWRAARQSAQCGGIPPRHGGGGRRSRCRDCAERQRSYRCRACDSGGWRDLLERVKLAVIWRQRSVALTAEAGIFGALRPPGVVVRRPMLFRSSVFQAQELDKLYSELVLLPV